MRKIIALSIVGLALLIAGCSFLPGAQGDAQREAVAKSLETTGPTVGGLGAFLPPPFNLIVGGLVGNLSTLGAAWVRGGKTTPPGVTP